MLKKGTKYLIIAILMSVSMLGVGLASPVFAAAPNQSPPSAVPPQPPAPPANFNPLTATAVQLKLYGFPARPTNAAALAQWEDVMSHAKHYVRLKPVQGTVTEGLVGNIRYNQTWAGYSVQSADNYATYYESWAEWAEPSYSGGDDHPSFWTGMGGNTDFSSNVVVQAGSMCNAEAAGAPWPYDDCFWTEDFNGAPPPGYNNKVWFWYPYETPYQAPLINAGNYLAVDVTYGGSTSTAFFENVSTQKYSTVQFDTPYWDGSSADYINEEAIGEYAAWGSTTLSDCGFNCSYGNAFLSGSLYREFYMTDNGNPPPSAGGDGTPEAWPGTVSDSSFTVTAKSQ